MSVFWMIFGKNGKYVASPNTPYQLTNMLTGKVSGSGWVINRVFFAPSSDSYLLTDNVSSPVTFQQSPAPQGPPLPSLTVQQFPADVTAGVTQLIQAGLHFNHLSWVSNGVWAAVGNYPSPPPANIRLGAKVPQTLLTSLAGIESDNADKRSELSIANIIFAPSEEWLAVGYDPEDHSSPTVFNSPGFPADIIAAANGLPGNVAPYNITFNPQGGWVMVDTSNNYHQSNAPADLSAAVTQFQEAGNILTDIAIVTLSAPIYPIQASQPAAPGSFDVLQGGKGAAMRTTVSVQSSGALQATTEIRTSNDLVGAHGSVLVLLIDFTGATLWTSQEHRFGIDGKWIGASDTPDNWNEQVNIDLSSARYITILHAYSPDDLGTDLTKWVNAGASPIAQIIKALASL